MTTCPNGTERYHLINEVKIHVHMITELREARTPNFKCKILTDILRHFDFYQHVGGFTIIGLAVTSVTSHEFKSAFQM